jgi:hypothetical protein
MRRFQNWPQKNAEITKRLEFSAFFAFSCGYTGFLKVPPIHCPGEAKAAAAEVTF